MNLTTHEPITIHLPLTRHWYDETVKAENPKRIEYRSLTSIDPDTKQVRPSKNIRDIYERRDRINRVRFSRAYTKTTVEFEVFKIDLGPCPIPGWTAPEYIRIHFRPPAPFQFTAIGIDYGKTVGLGDATGKVVGFKGNYIAVVEFGLATRELPLEGFL